MKKLLYIIVACSLFCSCSAQKNSAKIHAYKQPTMRGASPVSIADEKLKEPAKQPPATLPPGVKLSMSYMIYVESSAANFEVKNVWINKEGFAVSTEVVQKTPVLMMHSITINATPDTLVKQTNAKVLLVKPVPGSQVSRPSTSVQKKIAANELVVHCVINGKNQYYTVAAIKKLPPLALQ
jgi:hypothetical protein